jgi:N12 class adenine-specific DNA methylase
MAFEDSLIGNGDDFDPRAALDSLIRQQSAEPLPETLDPRMLNARLARKLNQPTPPAEMPSIDATATQPAAAPDFSAQAVEPAAAISTDADFSGQAVEPPMIGPEAPPVTNTSSTVGLYATEAAKGVAEGVKGMGASALKAGAPFTVPTVAAPDLLDQLAGAKELKPPQLAKLQGRVLRDVSDRVLQMDYIAALRRISQGGDAAKEIEALRPKFEANNARSAAGTKGQPLYKAGEAVEDFGKETLKAAPGFEGSWTRDIGSGFGSLGAGIAVTLIPGAGPYLGGTLFAGAGMGEATDRAIKGGATEEQTRNAALLGGAAGATDLVDGLIPFLGGPGRALGFIKRVGLAAIKGAMLEGGQEGVQQLAQNAIAKGIYKPDQDLAEGVTRSMAIAAIVGGTAGGLAGAATRDRADAPPGIAPPPGGGAAPGPSGDPAGGPSSPEDIADFVRRARESAPPPESGADAQPRNPDSASMSEAERMRAYTASRDSHGGASEADILKAAGLDPASMDEQQRIDAVIRATKPVDATGNAQGNAQARPQAEPKQDAGVSHIHDAVLREAGYSEEDIDLMSPAQRAAEFKDAVEGGIKPGAAMGKHKKRPPKPTQPQQQDATEQPESATTSSPDKVVSGDRPVDTGLGFGNLGNAGKDIGDSLRDHLWGRVEAGEESEGNGLGKSALLQGAKMIRERGGLQTRAEFDAYGNEQSKLTVGTPGFQQGMRDLVAKYAKNDTGQNVPESRATLKAQQNQLVAGERSAQMFPKGTREMPLPPGMERVETGRGIFHFDPKKLTSAKITEASAAGRENELLGLGSFTKADIAARAGERSVTIVERTPDGVEVRAAVGSESTADQQLAEMEKGKSPGNMVSFETTEQTLEARKPKGTRDEPIDIKTTDDVARASAAAATDYTPAQGEANNRKLGHAKWNGLPVSLEVAKGGKRKMVNPETGEAVEVTHAGAAYGYFPGTMGADGMHVDLYLGDQPDSPTVYVIDEVDNKTGSFRQHKVMGGFTSERDAFAAYVGTSTKSRQSIGAYTTMSVSELKTWLAEGDTTKALKLASSGPVKAEDASATSTEVARTSDAIPKETPSPATGEEAGRSKPATQKKPASSDEPLTLLQFLAGRGGLAPDPELTALDIGDHRVQIPGRKGFFGLIRPAGMKLDMAREAAEEAGYLRGEKNKTSTIHDLLDLIDDGVRGQHKMAEGDEGKTTKRQRTSLAESSAAARDAAIMANVEAIQAEYTELPDGLAEQAATIMADEMLDLDTAVEMAAVRAVNEDTDYEITTDDITATYGEEAIDAIQARPASGDGHPATPARDQERQSEEGEEAISDGEPDARAGAEGGQSEALTKYAHGVVGPDVESVHLVGGMARNGKGKDTDLLYDIGRRELSDDSGEAADQIEAIIERTKIDLDAYDTFLKSGDRYFHVSTGAGRAVVENTKYAAEQAGKPSKLLARAEGDLFVEIAGKRLPLTSYAAASEAYMKAIEQTGATSSGKTGPQAPLANITNSKGEVVAHISYNGNVWSGDRETAFDPMRDEPTTLLYNPTGPQGWVGPDEGDGQSVIPGAERIGQGEQAQRRADQPLRPKLPQKPADAGLFGDEMDQRDLLDQIETSLGPDADRVAPVDIARAAEIMADNPGMEPETAFGQAVVVNAVEQGFITEQEAIDAYGEEVQDVLATGREGASARGGDLEQDGAAPLEVGTGGAAQAGELPGRGEAGAEGDTAGAGPTKAGAAAGRDEAVGDQTGDTVGDQPAAQTTDLALKARADGFNTSREFWHGTTYGKFTEFKQSKLDDDVLGPAAYLSTKGGAEFYGPGRGGDLLGPFWVRGKIVTPEAMVPWDPDASPGKMAPALNVMGKLRLALNNDRFREPWGKDLTAQQYAAEFWKRRGVAGYDSGGGLEVAIYDTANIRAGFTLDQPAAEDADDAELARRSAVAAASDNVSYGQGPHFAAGASAFKAGEPRELPGYFTKPKHKNAKDWFRGYDRAMADARDAPTWAEILAQLPMSPDGRTRQHEIAFNLMTEITGDRGPAYNNLTPAQKHELMDRLAGPQKEPNIQAEDDSNGIPPSLPTSDAPASAGDVQPAQPGGDADGVRGREGSGGEQAVPRADGERAEGIGRVSEGAGGERGDRASDVGDARLSEPRADDAADGRAQRAQQRAADAAVEGENFSIEPGALDEGRSFKRKAIDNIRALEIMQKIEQLDRPARLDEQQDLAKYVGWGGIKGAFRDGNGLFSDGLSEIGQKLEQLLTPEEHATARRSIQYAHYTAEDVVRAMWAAVSKMGFSEGQVFEPGMGVGNFAGMMPADIAANTHYSGLELDPTTARIAKLLYPKWGVRQDDFTKAPLPENNYDLVIGNPPFADVAIKSDPKYKQGFLLHDYFFAKSIDAVRPGGLLAFVTSAGTMNKVDPGAREYLADRADLLGAIRLPGDAFLKNAGTAVTTDIIFLRKRLPGDIAGDRTWTETVSVTLPNSDGMQISGNMNRYFSEHPEMVLGEQGFFDKLYKNRYAVRAIKGSDFKANLAAAIDRLPAGVMSPWQGVQADHTQQDFDTTEKKEGTYYIGPDGSLHQVSAGVGRKVGQRGKGVENGRTAADMERIKGLIPVRDSLREVYAADLAGDTPNAERARAALNKNYDAFVEKFGPINKSVIQIRRPNVIQMEGARAEAREEARYAGEIFKEGSFDATELLDAKTPLSVIARKRQEMREDFEKRYLNFDEGQFDPDEVPDVIIDKRPNVDPFMDDPESYRLRAIERYDEGTGKGHKSPVFFENIISRETPPKISSVNDALLYSLSKYGRVNIPAMAELAKKSESEVIEALGDQVFKVPGTKDAFQTRDEYLSGNVRKKLALAEAAANKNPEFRRNVTALEAAQPIPLAPSQIHATLGMPWIPADVVKEFGIKALGLESLKVSYTPKLALWMVSGDTDSVAATTTWGTTDRRAPALLKDALNRQTVKVYDKFRNAEGREESVLNVAKTEAAQDKIRAMQEKFASWIWEDQARSDRLAGFYNENFNNLVVRQYDGDYLTTPGISTEWRWRPHQKRVIARIIQSGNTYVAHAVGAGKTSEYIGAIMEMRRLGLVRKPMVTVPNHMLAQFTKEWYEQYPTARLAIADDKRFHTDRRKQFVANVAMDDLDAVIITHSAFGMIPVSADFSNSIIRREIDQYRSLLADLQGGDARITRSRVEKQIERLEQRLMGKGTTRKDSVFTFEEMGIDHLTVDEAHLFRKLDFSTNMSNLKGVSPEGSTMAWDLYVKSLYLDTIRPGRGLVLGSGTPITNTMAELYTLSRYMQPQVLAERGLEKFDAWAGAFGESVSELEQDAAGNYKPVSRFAKFVNVAELSAMVRQVMDVVTSKQLSQYVTRPEIAGGKRTLHLAEKSRALIRFQESLAARMKAIQARKGPPQKGDDIMLSVINDGRHAAIDMRLAGGTASNEPSKLEIMIDNVYRIWEETKKQKFYKVKAEGGYEDKPAMSGSATQLVFVNLGLSGARGFAVPDYIRAELARRGIPKNEVAYIYDYKSATAKQRLFNDMNEGKVRILIGSVAKMGVGTNVQRRLAAIHNMDPLWYPADDEQRNGRGIRQGNMNREIAINDYATKGTYDSTMWGMMAKKGKFIEGFFEGDPSMRDMDDLGESSQYEQAKAMTTNDPRLIRFTEMKQELEKATRRKSSFDSEVYHTRQRRARAASEIEHYEQRVVDTAKDIKQRVDTRADAFKGKVGKETFDKRVDFGEALFAKLENLAIKGTLGGAVQVAEVGGFPIYAEVRRSQLLKNEVSVDVFMGLNGAKSTRDVSYETSPLGTVRSIESILGGFESDLAEYKSRLAKAQKFYAESEIKAKAKFEGDAEIEALTKQVNELAAELAKPVDAPAPPAPAEDGAAEPELASLSNMTATLTPLAAEKQAEVSQMLTAIVRAVAGDIPGIEFHEGLIPVEPPPGYPAGMSNKAAGQYRLGQAIIRLALTSNAEQMATTAFHESFHHVEDRLLTAAELKLMREETPRLREWIKGKTGMTDAQVDGLAGYEVRATAFQTYATDRVAKKPGAGNGIHIGARRWFERLMDMLLRIKNALKSLGFNTAEDVFNETFTGKVAARGDRGAGGIDHNDLSSLADMYGPVAERIHNRFGERFKELRVKLQDRFIRVRDVQDSFGGVPTAQDAYMAETLLPGRTGFRLEELERNHFEPLIEEMESRGVALEEISDYLYAKHAPERNAAMDAINHPNLAGTGGRDLRGRGSGMSDDEAAEIMDRIRAAGRMGDFEALEARVREIQRNTADTLVEYGLISQDTADAWAAQYEFYAPLQGFDEAFEDESLAGVRGAGLDTRARETKQAFGRLSKAAGPLPYIMMQAQLAIVRGEKNRVGNTFLKLVRSHPLPDLWSVNVPKLKKTIDRRTGLVTMVADTNWHNDPNVFVTKLGGNVMVIRMEGKRGQDIARALKNMGVENLSWLLSFIRPLTVTMARLSTQWNPNFILPNFARDLGEAYINMQAQRQQDFIKNFTKHLIPAIGGSFNAMRGSGGGRYADAFREYDAAGGRVRFFGLDNAADAEKKMRQQMRALQGGPVATLQEMGKRIGDALDLMAGPMENATRLAAYMAARDVGMSIPESANLALNLTVNFSKGGEWRAVINSLYMFSNAALQGARRNVNALKNKHVRRATYVLIGIGALSAALGFGMGGDDESGENYYGKIPHWERDKNLIIMWPKGFGRDGGYIKIPTPFLFGTMKVIGDRMAGLAMGHDKVGESIGAVLKSMIDSLNPLGEEAVSLFSLFPSVARPGLHIATNMNWNGRPVYPARDWEKNKPESEQYFQSTPEYAKAAARGLNKATGGSPYKSGGVDVHPGSIQHVIESLTGGVGKFLSDVSGTADRAWKGEAFDATKAPIARRFFGSSNTEQSDAARYYAEREEARKNGGDAIRNARRDRARGVNKDAAESFLRENTNSARGEQIFKNADDLMKPLRERKGRIEAGDSLTEAQRAEVESIKQRMRDIQNKARKEYRELTQGAP